MSENMATSLRTMRRMGGAPRLKNNGDWKESGVREKASSSDHQSTVAAREVVKSERFPPMARRAQEASVRELAEEPVRRDEESRSKFTTPRR